MWTEKEKKGGFIFLCGLQTTNYDELPEARSDPEG